LKDELRSFMLAPVLQVACRFANWRVIE